jgi:hypothetical protein
MLNEESGDLPLLTLEVCHEYVGKFKEGGFEVYHSFANVEFEQVAQDSMILNSRKRIEEVGNMLEEIRNAQYMVEELFLKMPRTGSRSRGTSVSNIKSKSKRKSAAEQAEETAQSYYDMVTQMYKNLQDQMSHLKLVNVTK